MMLLRTLVLERAGVDAPVNGALLCGFAIPQIMSNFLVYSLDEEAEPGSSRVYVAALRKKLDRYFLSAVDAQEELQVAMRVFKQILMLAASGAKPGSVTDSQIPYHFVDLKGCKLPPARPEDHHSVVIKKALVMKVITLGTSAPVSPALESATLVVPSIRFSSQMASPFRAASRPEADTPPLLEQLVEPQLPPQLPPQPQTQPQTQLQAEPQPEPLPQVSVVVAPANVPPVAPAVDERPALCVQTEQHSLFEVDSTLNNLARVSHELTQQKLAVLKQAESLEQWHVQLQQGHAELDEKRQELVDRTLEKEATLQLRVQALEGREAQVVSAMAAQQHEQHQLDERAQALEKRISHAQSQELQVLQKKEVLAAMLAHLPGLRQNLQTMLIELDQTLDSLADTEQA